jgi:hypothetical protein
LAPLNLPTKVFGLALSEKKIHFLSHVPMNTLKGMLFVSPSSFEADIHVIPMDIQPQQSH